MARLTSRASVLAALDPSDAPLLSGQTRAAESRGPLGYEIWESARRQAEFHAAYAEMLETRRRPRRGDEWVQETYPDQDWVGPATLASSYRLAAQHAALVDAGWATKLAVRAGMAYVAAGLPFGLFLLTGLLDDQTLDDSAVFGDIVEPFREPDATDAVRHPVQLTYLLLAAASRPRLRDPLRQTVSGAEQRLIAHGLHPAGPHGIPLGDYLELANIMRYDDETVGLADYGGLLRDIAARLAGLYRTHAATLRAAQRNRYLWRQGASPVSIIDLEQVAMSGLMLRHRAWFDPLSEAITAELDRDDELAQLPVWTMGSIETQLPGIVPSVTDIMREPDRAWRTADFRDAGTEVDPWYGEWANWTRPDAEETRPEYPGPGHELALREDEYDSDGDDPYSPDQKG